MKTKGDSSTTYWSKVSIRGPKKVSNSQVSMAAFVYHFRFRLVIVDPKYSIVISFLFLLLLSLFIGITKLFIQFELQTSSEKQMYLLM